MVHYKHLRLMDVHIKTLVIYNALVMKLHALSCCDTPTRST